MLAGDACQDAVLPTHQLGMHPAARSQQQDRLHVFPDAEARPLAQRCEQLGAQRGWRRMQGLAHMAEIPEQLAPGVGQRCQHHGQVLSQPLWRVLPRG